MPAKADFFFVNVITHNNSKITNAHATKINDNKPAQVKAYSGSFEPKIAAVPATEYVDLVPNKPEDIVYVTAGVAINNINATTAKMNSTAPTTNFKVLFFELFFAIL